MPSPFTQIARHCYSDSIGAAGVDPAAIDADRARAVRRLSALKESLGRDARFDCLAAASWQDDLAPLEEIARRFADLDDVLLVGIGGSALGARTLGAVASGGSKRCRLHVLDNLQAGRLEALLGNLDARRTGVLLVSKSGSTAEVLSQALVILPHLAAWGGGHDLARRVVGIAVPGDNPLRQLAAVWGFVVLDHPVDVAGRYSVFTLVGMLPAIIMGLDPVAVRRGGVAALEDPLMPAAEGAALMAAFHRRNTRIAVNLAYDERLVLFTQWHAQLWAESLGKAGHGMTPVAALGPLDQHSQLQLYLDGPPDKVFTVYVSRSAGVGQPVARDQIDGIESLSYLAGRTIGDIVAASARATTETLVAHGRPVRLLLLPRIDGEMLGSLFMHFMLETVLTADLMGVDPFDQPAVDEGKVRARDYLRSGRVAIEP